MTTLEAVIGLEVHVQLLTQTKLFSGASARFGSRPNENITQYCAALPGTLPVINDQAVRMAAKFGLAVNATVARRSIFARKNYFYPDLPKGYQISQYEQPLFNGGEVGFRHDGEIRSCRLHRIHLEEDAGKTSHFTSYSLVDLNRAGVALIEIVTEPDLHSSEEAVTFLKELRRILVFIGVTDGNMEEGSFRCDANISIHEPNAPLGTRTEIKNLNSFRFIESALNFEIYRQQEIVEGGGSVLQETRLFDERTGETRPMRGKEEAEDYRYFPDPDLPELIIAPELWAEIEALSSELPLTRHERYVSEWGVSASTADLLVREALTAEVFEQCVQMGAPPRRTAALIENLAIPELGDEAWRTTAESEKDRVVAALAAVAEWVEKGRYALSQIKPFVRPLLLGELGLEMLLERLTTSAPAVDLQSLIEAQLERGEDQVRQYLEGNNKVLGFFMGAVLREHRGLNPQEVRKLLVECLERRRV